MSDDDYTPTTEEIRTEFCYDERNPVNNYGELFDRWLRGHEKAERLKERERIIELLDESFIYDEPVVIERDRLVALIKGENE